MFTKNISNKLLKSSSKVISKKIIKGLAYGSLAITCGLCFTEVAYAAWDFDKLAKDFTAPLVKLVKDYWQVGVMLGGVGNMLRTPGDLKEKAVAAGIGCGVAGGVVTAVISASGA